MHAYSTKSHDTREGDAPTGGFTKSRFGRFTPFAIPTALALTIALPVAYGQFATADPQEAPAPAAPAAPAPGGEAPAGDAAPFAEDAVVPADQHRPDGPVTPDTPDAPGGGPADTPSGPPLPGGPEQKTETNDGLSSGISSIFGSSNPFNYLEEGEVPERTSQRTEYPKIEGLPAGVSVERQEWLSSHRVALFIRSAAMPDKLMQVQLLLARDWYSHPQKRFPTLWMLDGMRATEEESGWTLHTNIEQFFADKNVTIVLPVGGAGSFYTDWDQPDGGTHFNWESFLTGELPAVLHNGYRASGTRGIAGLSMGGTAAVNLAEHRPDMFDFVGSYSGYLDLTSAGMFAAVDRALNEEGLHAVNMWGPEGSQRWIDNDPKYGVEALRGKTVYVSSGSGRDDYGEPGSVAQGPANEAGRGLEVISRMTSETFSKRAQNVDGLKLVTKFRPSGVHAWPYWQFEMAQSWPHVASALNLSTEDRGSECELVGEIGNLASSGQWGSCINNEYDVDGGRAQDFRGGQAFWSPETGAHMLIGRIGARYNELGGPSSFLGFPTTNELATPDGVGRFVHFENGSIYWTPTTGAVEIPKDMFMAWEETGWEAGALGYPVAEPRLLEGSWIQQFQGGYVIRTPEDKVFWSKGLIARKYGEMKATQSDLGAPTSNEIVIPGGALQDFEHGHIYWSHMTGAHVVLDGAIYDHWASQDYERGKFGWPTSDLKPIPAGGLEQHFEHGTIRQINGKIVEEVRVS